MYYEFECELMFADNPDIILARDMRLLILIERVVLPPGPVQHSLHHHEKQQ